MPAPMSTFIPRRSNGNPAPGFGPRGVRQSMSTGAYDGGMAGFASMGDMLPMSQVASDPSAPWQGPWMSMNQMQPQPAFHPGQQQMNDWVITGPQVYPAGGGGAGGSFMTMPDYEQALNPPQAQADGLFGMGAMNAGGRLGGFKFIGILAGVALAWWYFMGRTR